MVGADVKVLVGDGREEGTKLELQNFFLLQDISEIPNFLFWLSKEWFGGCGLEFLLARFGGCSLAGFLLTRQRFKSHCKMSTS